MNYKGYAASLTGVYKLENGQKRHSLQIKNAESEIVYESAHIYADEKEAFDAAKRIIKQALKQNSFEGIVYIREKRQSGDIWVKINWTKIKRVAHIINSFTVIALICLHISQFFFMNIEESTAQGLGIMYAFFGLLFALIFQKKKGWYSSTPLIELLFEGFFSVFVLFYAKGYLFVSIIITLALMVLNYIVSVIWEVADAKEKYEAFPFRRVVIPWLTLIIIVAFGYFYTGLLKGY